MQAWGFRYKTQAVWVKDKIGTGFYFRNKHEDVLLGVRGNPGTPEEKNRPPSVFESPRLEHSVKPDILYEIIEKMYPDRKYLELFATPAKHRNGWVMWGSGPEDIG